MILQDDPPFHLSYCLNVHPGERLEDNLNAVRAHAVRVKQRIAPDSPFGLGLRFGHQATVDLLAMEDLGEIKASFDDLGVYGFTINGFPYGAFHQTSVKENVYRPDWQTDERVDYTKKLADALSQLLPPNTAGSISTVPLSFKAFNKTEADFKQMAENLADCADYLAKLEAERGTEIHLGLEPEPCCSLETTQECIDYFNQILFPHGSQVLADRSGRERGAAEALIRRHIGVCLDTCHLAIQYENLAESFDRLVAEGIRISKVHISAALQLPNQPESLAALAPFAEPVYLHQVKARAADGSIRSWDDLPAGLEAVPLVPDIEELRVHFHVPLFWEGSEVLGSTSGSLDDAFFARLKTGACNHAEIETYTFDVLPDELRADDIADSITAEFEWALERWGRQASFRSGAEPS